MAITDVFSGIPVVDFPSALAWYERLVGRPADFLPNETEAVWRLGEPHGWIYIVLDPDRAGHALLTVLVDDLEAHVAELARRGIVAGEIDMIPGAVKKAEVLDTDGNRTTFGEPLGVDD